MTDLLDTAVRWTEQDAVDFERTLTPESLSAIMRATWTWDDRALRRDLSQLLVDLAAARAVEVTLPRALAAAAPVRRVLRWRNLQRAGRFLAHVLGPRLIADTGQPNTFELAEAVLAVPSLRLPAGEHRAALLTVAGYVLDGSAAADPRPPRTRVPRSRWRTAARAAGPCEIGAVHGGARRRARRPRRSWPPPCSPGTHCSPAVPSTRTPTLLAAIASGTVTATLAAAERGGSWDPALVRCRATPVAGRLDHQRAQGLRSRRHDGGRAAGGGPHDRGADPVRGVVGCRGPHDLADGGAGPHPPARRGAPHRHPGTPSSQPTERRAR